MMTNKILVTEHSVEVSTYMGELEDEDISN